MSTNDLRYDPRAARAYLNDAAWEQLADPLETAREVTLHDVTAMRGGEPIPLSRQPLDAGFIDLPERLLAGEDGLLQRIEASAEQFRNKIDRMLVLGIGGSYMGLRALFEGLCHPYHNDLPRPARRGAPQLHYEGNNLDNSATAGLLEVLRTLCTDPKDLAHRWGIVVISKSGGTLETAVAFRIFRAALEEFYGADSGEARELIIPITGQQGRLRDLSNARGYPDTFPIPDGVGGRFSVFTAVGLYPAAVLRIDIHALLQGAADMTARFRRAPLGENPVLDYVRVCHLLERDRGMDLRVLSTWGGRLEALGLWYDQLLAESLGKQEKGATPLTVVNTRDLHSRGQQHQEGKRDRLITNLIVEDHGPDELKLLRAELDDDQLNRLAGTGIPTLLRAAIEGTNEAYAEDSRPTADLILPRLDAYSLGQVLQMFMLATVVEGRLVGINPYGQPGVESYKKNMGRILYGG